MTEYRKSSFCSGGDCVEVGPLSAGGVWIRSSLDRGRIVAFTPEEWEAFIAGAKAGEFDPEALA